MVNVDIELPEINNENIIYDLNSNDELKLSINSFDLILCQEVIEHIENPWKIFRLFRRYLKCGGKIILTTPNIQSKLSKWLFIQKNTFHWFTPEYTYWHINALPLWEINLLAERNGFKIDCVTGNSNYYFKHANTINNCETLIITMSLI